MEFYTYSFEKLDVWKDSRELVKMIYLLTKTYPASELYGLSSQMRRAAVSVSANLSEGSGRIHIKEQAHFYQIAYSSAIELLNEIILSHDLNYIKNEEYNQTRLIIEKITRQIAQLRKNTNSINR
jgi:four helix bundle protein